MEKEYVRCQIEEGIAIVTIDNPASLNALNTPTLNQLDQIFDKLAGSPEVKGVIITGGGEKSFVAGADISEFLQVKGNTAAAFMARGQRIFDKIETFDRPVIASINGFTLGGGNELAMSCDIIIASENAQFGQPEINVGVIPGAGGTQVLPRLVGEKKAKELVFTGAFISAQEALALGLVNKVVPQEKLRDTVMEMARAMLRHSPVILKLCKLAINKSLDVPLSIGMDYERDLFAMCFGTEDQKEGSKAFLEKRKPQYNGK